MSDRGQADTKQTPGRPLADLSHLHAPLARKPVQRLRKLELLGRHVPVGMDDQLAQLAHARLVVVAGREQRGEEQPGSRGGG